MPAPKGNKFAVGNKGGRPKAEIDYEAVEKLASIMATQEEIASFLHLHVRTLQKDDEFNRVYKRGLESGRMSLRRTQFKSAQAGNVTMQIWLGKQYLNQTERQRIENHNINADLLIDDGFDKALKNTNDFIDKASLEDDE